MVASNLRPTPDPPPWSQVIVTTIRLWWRRRVWLSLAQPPPGKRAYWRISVVVLSAALVAASATAIDLAVSHPRAAAPAHSYRPPDLATKSTPAAAGAAVDAATASRQQAAIWIAAQVGHSVIVSCDPLMCAALQQHDFPAADLAPIEPTSADPLGSGIVVSTPAVRSLLGARLTSVYAPLVIASFGTGAGLVQVLVTAPAGTKAYESAERTGVAQRKVAGKELLTNKNVHPSAAARTELAAGAVDTRLMVTLAALAHRAPVYLASFTDSGPNAAPATQLRAMTIRATSSQYLHSALAFLQAQRAPLLALTAVRHTGQVTFLQITFTAPSPTGLLTQN